MTRMLDENEATGKTKEIFEEIREAFGQVPNLFRAQAAVDPEWLAINWKREKSIMLSEGALDRKTKELLAMAIALNSHCEYCSLAHETMAMMVGASEQEINEAKQVIELFSSFSSIANSLRIPCDIDPSILQKE